MSSNSSRGAYYKKRSKDWLLERGHPVADMEIVRTNHTPNGVFTTKKDQFGSDLLYLAVDVPVFVQTKGGGKPTATLIKDAEKAFGEVKWSKHCRRELHIWRPRKRAPEIIEWPTQQK